MKTSNIICEVGQLNLHQHTGNIIDTCYYISLSLLWQYILIVQPEPFCNEEKKDTNDLSNPISNEFMDLVRNESPTSPILPKSYVVPKFEPQNSLYDMFPNNNQKNGLFENFKWPKM